MNSVAEMSRPPRQRPDLGRAARWYAEKLDWPVAPAHYILPDGGCSCGNAECASPGKHPLTANGFKDATTDAEVIHRRWSQSPEANVILPTGGATGLLVLDIDPDHGGDETLASLEAEQGLLPPTVEQITGSGGRHLLFKFPGPEYRNTAGKVGPGIDSRGEGGYIIAAPSNHRSGNVYRWRDGHKPGQIDIAEAPSWLLGLLKKRAPRPGGAPSANGGANAYVETALADEVKATATATEGTRNAQLNTSAFALGQLVGADLVNQGRVERALTDAAQAAGLSQVEIERTLESGLEAGIAEPREVSAPVHLVPGSNGTRGATAPEPRAEGAAWADLVPLPEALPNVPDMPDSLVPPVLRPWLCDICERAQIPLDYTAAPAVVALSSLIGRTVGLYPKQRDDWLVAPNLWGVVIGRPGVLKSPAMVEALKPLQRLAHAAGEEHKEVSRLGEAKATVIQAKLDAAKGEARTAAKEGNNSKLAAAESDIASLAEELEQAECHERRYIVNDGTVEKLGELLNTNPRGLLLKRDELMGLLRSLDKQGHEADRAFYLEAWAGNGAFTYDRIGRGTIHIPALTLSLIGGMTPGKLQSYISAAVTGGADDDGLLQRFQVSVWPDLGREWKNVDRYPDTAAKNQAFEIFQKLDELKPDAVGAEVCEDEIPGLRFAPDAQELFDEFRGQLEQQIRCGDDSAPAFESHLAKYRSLMPSLALIFHLVEIVQSGNVGPVSLDAARLAAMWCEYLKQHARRIYAAELYPDLTAAHLLASKIRVGAISDGTNVRDIYRPQWAGLTKADVVWAGLEKLKEHNFIRITQKDTAGRQADVIEINPAAKRKAA